MAGMNLSGCGLYYMTPYPDDFQITVVYPQFDEGSEYLKSITFSQAYEEFKRGSKNILRVVYNSINTDTYYGGVTTIWDLQFISSNNKYNAFVVGGGSIGPSFSNKQDYVNYYNYYVPDYISTEHRHDEYLSVLFRN